MKNIIAYGMPFSALKNRLKPSDVIGFTCMFSQDWVFIRELIQRVRQLSPDSLLVAGGEHITAVPEYALKDCPELDICVVGEGEEAFTQLLSAIESKKSFSEVGSLVFRDKKNEFIKTAKKARIEEIDKIPLPAWDLVPLENYLSRSLNYHIERGRTIPMLATRGCPYKCTFCSNPNMWGNAWLPRSPKLVVDEMETYVGKYAATNFIFSDLTAVIKKSTLISLCNEILSRGLKITWQLPTTRTESFDRDTLNLMYEAGCRDLDFAVESGSKEVLKSVQKGNKPAKMASSIKEALKARMNLSINIILGLPGEGFRDFLKTYFLAMRLACAGLQEINVFPFIPYPGSELFFKFVEKGKLTLSDNYFLDLYSYANLASAISWSDKFGPRTLSFLRLFLMSSFYALMFLTHPKRIIHFFLNVFRGTSTTKLEGVLKRIFRTVQVYTFKKRIA